MPPLFAIQLQPNRMCSSLSCHAQGGSGAASIPPVMNISGSGPRAERDGTQTRDAPRHRGALSRQTTWIEVRVADVVVCRRTEWPCRAVLVEGLLDLGRDIVERFLPADALPFVLAAHLAVRIIGAPALALHGILDARRRQHVADLGATARACTPLRHLDACLHPARRCGFFSGTPSSTYTPQQTSATIRSCSCSCTRRSSIRRQLRTPAGLLRIRLRMKRSP